MNPSYGLEPLESRLMLSGSGLIDEAVALTEATIESAIVFQGYQADEEITLSNQAASTYLPEAQLSDLFGSGGSRPSSDECELDTEAENPDAEKQTESIETRAGTSDVEKPSDGIGPNHSPAAGMTDELVETLNAAQPPPLTELVSFALEASDSPTGLPGTASDLTPEQLNPIVSEAKSRWSESGLLDEAEEDLLDALSFEIVDLDGLMLGSISANIIQIDVNAAGHGWFVDSTPAEDEEFALESAGQLMAEPGSDASERIDLLTAATHEIGHSLGYVHLDSGLDPGDLMNGTLDTGIRRNVDAEIPAHQALQGLRACLADLSESFGPAAANLKSALETDYSDSVPGLSESLNDLFGPEGMSAYLDFDVHLSDFVSTFDWSGASGPADAASALVQYLDDNWTEALPGLGEASFEVTSIQDGNGELVGFEFSFAGSGTFEQQLHLDIEDDLASSDVALIDTAGFSTVSSVSLNLDFTVSWQSYQPENEFSYGPMDYSAAADSAFLLPATAGPHQVQVGHPDGYQGRIKLALGGFIQVNESSGELEIVQSGDVNALYVSLPLFAVEDDITLGDPRAPPATLYYRDPDLFGLYPAENPAVSLNDLLSYDLTSLSALIDAGFVDPAVDPDDPGDLGQALLGDLVPSGVLSQDDLGYYADPAEIAGLLSTANALSLMPLVATLADLEAGLNAEHALTQIISGTDFSAAGLLGIFDYLHIGNYIDYYLYPYRNGGELHPEGPEVVYATGHPTMDELVSFLEDTWLAELKGKGLGGGIGGLSWQQTASAVGLIFTSQDTYAYSAQMNLPDEARDPDQLGAEIHEEVDFEVSVTTDIALSFSVDWLSAEALFTIQTFDFQSSGGRQGLILEGAVGPLSVSFGQEGASYQQSYFVYGLGGSLIHSGDSLAIVPAGDPDLDSMEIVLPVYTSLAGSELGAGLPILTLSGPLFAANGDHLDLAITTANFEQLSKFSSLTLGDVENMYFDLLLWIKDFKKLDLMELEIPFIGLPPNYLLDFASVFEADVIQRINFLREMVFLFGSGGSMSAGDPTFTVGQELFAEYMVGKYLGIPGMGTFEILAFTDPQNLTIDYLPAEDLADLSFAVTRDAFPAGDDGTMASGGSKFSSAAAVFTEAMVGQQLSIEGHGTYDITGFTAAAGMEPEYLTIAYTAEQDLSGELFVIQDKVERISSLQEYVDEVEESGLLPQGRHVTYDLGTNTLTVPIAFQKTLPDIAGIALDLNLDYAAALANISTDAMATIHAAIAGSMTLVIDVDGATGSEDPAFLVDGARLTGSAEFEVIDPAVTASLGFVEFSAGGAGTGSGIELAMSVSSFLDADGDTGTVEDQAFAILDAVNGELGESFHFDLSGSLLAVLDQVTVEGLPGLEVDPAADELIIEIGDLADPGSAVVQLPELNVPVQDLGYEDILQGLSLAVGFLQDTLSDQPFYNDPIPGVNRSLADLFDFIGELAGFMTLLEEEPAQAIQQVEHKIEDVLGLPDESFALTLDGSVLAVELRWDVELEESYGFNLDLTDILPLLGADASMLEGLGALTDMLNASGTLAFSAFAEAVLKLGIDLEPLEQGAAPDIFLCEYDELSDEGTRARVGIKLIGSDLELGFRLGAMELGVRDGYVNVDKDGDRATNPDDRSDHACLAIGYKSGAPELVLSGRFDLSLPLEMVVLGMSNTFGEPLRLAGEFTNDGLSITYFTTPDIAGTYEELLAGFTGNPLLELLNDPSYVLDSIDLALGSLELVLGSCVSENLPLIGSKLAHAATFIHDFRTGFLADLREKLSGNGKAIEYIRESFWDVFGPGGLDIILDGDASGAVTVEDILVQWCDPNGVVLENWQLGGEVPDGADAIQFILPLGGTILGAGVDIPLEFDIPGLGLDIDGGFGLEIGWSLDFGIGLSLNDGFYLVTNADEANPELELTVDAYLDGSPLDPNETTPFVATGKLLFFELVVTDSGVDGGSRPSGVRGVLSIDIKGTEANRITLNHLLSARMKDVFGINFGVAAELNLLMELGVAEAVGLPKLKADFVFRWSWDYQNGATDPQIELANLRLDLGSVISDFLKPIAENIYEALRPVEKVIAVLNTPIPGLDFVMDDPTLKGFINLLLQMRGYKPIDWSFVDAVSYMLNIVATVDAMPDGESIEIPLGNILNFGSGNEVAEQASDPWAAAPEFAALFDKMSSDSKGGTTQERRGFEFKSYLTDIGNWMQLLTGGDATFFVYELPLMEFDFQFRQRLATFMAGPVPITISVIAGATAGADLSFGYDTFGIRKALASGNGWDVLDGFFIGDYDRYGFDKDELYFHAYAGLEGAVDLFLIRGGLRGTITLDAGIDLMDINQDGKVRISEMVTMWEYEDGGFLNLVNMHLSAGFRASVFAEVFALFDYETVFDATIFEITFLDIEHKAPQVQPKLAHVEGDTLYLHSGSRAGDRLYIDKEDGGEAFTLNGSGGTVTVSYGEWTQTYTGVSRVVGDLGAGKDTLDASELFDVTVNITGGDDSDTLICGPAGGSLSGGAGNDVLDGSLAVASVSLYGGPGDDRLTGGTGDDILSGGDGDDRLIAGEGNDLLDGGSGIDVLQGGPGNDTYAFADSFGEDHFSDTAGAVTMDFTAMSKDLLVTISSRSMNYSTEGGYVSTPRTEVIEIRLGAGNDTVYVSSFPERTITLRDAGGNDSYHFALGRPGSTRPNGVFHIDDNGGSFDEILAEQKYSSSPVVLNHYAIVNGREIITLEEGVERETLYGRAGLFTGRHALSSEVAIEEWGGNVSFTTTDPGGISDLGTAGLRVIAPEIDMQSEVWAAHIVMDSLQTLDVVERLVATRNGYIDLRTYAGGTDINLSCDLVVSAGAADDGEGAGWVRLTVPDGSILNRTGMKIIAAGSHLVMTAGNAIGTVTAPIHTRVARLTASTSESGVGDIILVEDDSLIIEEHRGAAVYEADGFTLRDVSVTPPWIAAILDGRGYDGLAVGAGDIDLLLLRENARLTLHTGVIVNRGSANITLTADDMDFLHGPETVIGSGELALRATSNPWRYTFGTAAENLYGEAVDHDTYQEQVDDPLFSAMELCTRDLAALADGFALITIGRREAGNQMTFGDAMVQEYIKYTGEARVRNASFRDLTRIYSDFISIEGEVQAPADRLEFYASNVQVNSQNIHLPMGLPESGITAGSVLLYISESILVSGWIRGFDSVEIQVHGTAGLASVTTDLGSFIESLKPGSLVDIDALKDVDIAGTVEAFGASSRVDIDTDAAFTLLEGGQIAARGAEALIDIFAADIMTLESGSGIVAGARWRGHMVDANGEVVASEIEGVVAEIDGVLKIFVGGEFVNFRGDIAIEVDGVKLDIDGVISPVNARIFVVGEPGNTLEVAEIQGEFFLDQGVPYIGSEELRLKVEKTAEGADVLITSAHELLIKGTVTSSDAMTLSAAQCLYDYSGYFSSIPDPAHYLIGHNRFSILLTGTLTTLADAALLELSAPEDIIIRGNINVLGNDSDLLIRSDLWVFHEGFISVQDNVRIYGGYDADFNDVGGADAHGTSVYVQATSRINTFQAGSSIEIFGARDVDIYGAVVAGGAVGKGGVTWAGPDSSVVVTAVEQVYLYTGLLASKTVQLNGGSAGADDNGLSVLIDTPGGLYSAAWSSDGSGGHIGIFARDNLEIMGYVVSGANVTLLWDAYGKFLGKSYDWSVEPSDVSIQALGQAYIGGHTVNAAGDPIETGGYVYANDYIHIIGGVPADDSGAMLPGVLVHGASEILTHWPDSLIEIDSTFDTNIQGVVLAGGEIELQTDENGTIIGRRLRDLGGASGIRVSSEQQVRVGSSMRAGALIELIGGTDPLEPDPPDGSTNHSGKSILLYGSVYLETWAENSQIILNGPGRVDILAPVHGYTYEIWASGWVPTADGKLPQDTDVTLDILLDKVDFTISATVFIPYGLTLDNSSVGDLAVDLQQALIGAEWTVIESVTAQYPVGSRYTGFASDLDGLPAIGVGQRLGKILFTSDYRFQILQSSVNGGVLGLTELSSAELASELACNLRAEAAGSEVTIGAPAGPNGKLYIAGKVLAYRQINLYSGASPDGVDIDLDWTGHLETVDGSIEFYAGEFGDIKGDIVANGAGADVIISAARGLAVRGDIRAERHIELSTTGAGLPAADFSTRLQEDPGYIGSLTDGEILDSDPVSVLTEGTSRLSVAGAEPGVPRHIQIGGQDAVVVNSTIGSGSPQLHTIQIASAAGDVFVAHESGWLETDATLVLQGRRVYIAGVMKNGQASADPEDWEIEIRAWDEARITGDLEAVGSILISGEQSVSLYDCTIRITDPDSRLKIVSSGVIHLGQLQETAGDPPMQIGALLAAAGCIQIEAAEVVEIGPAAQVAASQDNSQVSIRGAEILIAGSVYAGATLGQGSVVWTGTKATVALAAATSIVIGGSVQATGGISISTSQNDGGVGLFTSSESVLRTDATGGGALPAADQPSYLEIDTTNGIEIDGLVEAADEDTVVNITAGGLLVLDGVVKADQAVNLTGGSNASGIGIVLTQLVVQTDAFGNPLNEEGQPIDRDGFLIGLIDGLWVWVDETGNPIPAGGTPVYGGEAVRLSGGTLITGVDGVINLSAEQHILLLGMVGQVYKLNDMPAVDVATVNIESTSGDVVVYELVNARDAVNIEAQNIAILGDALVKTRHAGSQIYFRAQGTIFVERSLESTDRARVQAADLVHFYAGDIQVDGSLYADETGARIILNSVDDITIYGEVISLGDIELNAGVSEGLARSVSESGGFALADLSTGSIYLAGEALLDAVNQIVLRAADDVRLIASAEVGGQTTQAEPHIIQHAQTVQVVTGTRQVEDGFVTVPETHWITTTVTEQIGGELVVTGTRYYTMDVTLIQIGYWNPDASLSERFREYFVEGIDYLKEAVDWSGVGAPPSEATFDELSSAQRQRVLDTLGYMPLFDFTWENAQEHSSTDGTTPWDVPWANNPLKVVLLGLEGWNDKYIRIPDGGEEFLESVTLRMDPAGAAMSVETVGQWRDTAAVSYTQDRSSHTAYTYTQWIQDLYVYGLTPQQITSTVVDWDNSPARWSVSYQDNGRREFWIPDGRTGSNTVSFSNVPDWALAELGETSTDASGLPSYAPFGYFGATASLSMVNTSNRPGVSVGEDYNYAYHPVRYEYVATLVNWRDAVMASEKMGGSLATPRNRFQNAGVSAAAGDSSVWLGGYESYGVWYWLGRGIIPSPVSWFNWAGGEPNNAGSGEDQIMMCNDSWRRGFWNDGNFAALAPFVVQYEAYWESRTITETQYDYTYDWASQWHDITDQRLSLEYRWASQVETLTEQTGMEEVVVGTRFYTMDVTLTQDGYWNPDASEEARFREYFIEGIDYFNESIDWATTAAPPLNYTFGQLSDAQARRVLDTLGYKPLYDFSWVNPQEHGTIDGVPYTKRWDIPWAAKPTKVVFIDVDGWNDKYIRIPAEGEEYIKDNILRAVSQGEGGEVWYEQVGQYRDTARVLYAQDRSTLTPTAGTGIDKAYWIYNWENRDFDNSPARWYVSYFDSGTTEYSIDDGRTAELDSLPEWRLTGYQQGWDENGTFIYAPYGYFVDTESIENQQLYASYYRMVGDYWESHPTTYQAVFGSYNFEQATKIAVGVSPYSDPSPYTWSHVAYISNALENEIVLAISGYAGTWLGGAPSASYVWYWISYFDSAAYLLYGLSPMTFFNFAAGEPNYAGGEEWALEMVSNGQWNDLRWWWGRSFVIEYEPWQRAMYDIYETQYDYLNQWASPWRDISDKRLTLNYQWVSQDEEIIGQRTRFITYEAQIPVVEEKRVTKWRTELVYEERTVYTTERIYEDDPLQHDFGVFAHDSLRALDRIDIFAGRDVTLSGRVSALGPAGAISITAGGSARIEGLLPEGSADSGTIAAIAELRSSSSITVSSEEDLTVARSGLLYINDGGAGSTSSIVLDSGSSMAIEGELFSLDEVRMTAADGIALNGKITSGNLIEARAGEGDGAGDISGDIYGDLLTFASGSVISLQAGSAGGDISLTGSAASAIGGEIRLIAAEGSIFHNGGRLRGELLYARSAHGLSANTGVEHVDAALSGAGDLILANVGDIELDNLVTADGSIIVEGYGDIVATNVRTSRVDRVNDILLKTCSAGGDLEVGLVSADGSGDVFLNVTGSLTSRGPPSVIADHLSVAAGGEVVLGTQVNSLSLRTATAGDVEIFELDDLVLLDMQVADGSLSVDAAGTLVAEQVRLLTNSDANDIDLTAAEIRVGLIQAGLYAATQLEADAIRLSFFNAALRAVGYLGEMEDDFTRSEAEDFIQSTEFAGVLSAYEAHLIESGYSEEDAQAEAAGILRLTKLFTSFGDVKLTAAAGSIAEIQPEDPQVDLTADQAILLAQNGITGLELAVNTLSSAYAVAGSIDLSDQDGIGAQIEGLAIDEVFAAVGSITLRSASGLEIDAVEAPGAQASVTLSSETGSILITGAVSAGGKVEMHAGRDILVAGTVAAPQWLEFRAGGALSTVSSLLEFSADTIIIETGSSIEVDGVLSASELVELICNDGSITITGAIQGAAGGELKRISLIAQGNRITEGELAGYYEYQAAGETYYMDGQGRLYRLEGGELAEVADPSDLSLKPVLRWGYEQAYDELTGMALFADGDGQLYHMDVNGVFYLLQDLETGYYTYQGVDPETGAIQVYYSDLQNFENENGEIIATIYDSDKTTIVADPEVLNLSPAYKRITDPDFIETLVPVQNKVYTGEIIVSEGTVTLATELVRLHAHHAVVGLGLDISVSGEEGEIDVVTGGDITLASGMEAGSRISLVSIGYISPEGVEAGGSILLAGDAATTGPLSAVSLQAGYGIETIGQARIETHNLDMQAGSGIHVSTQVDRLSAKLSGTGSLVVDETDDIELLEILVADGAVEVTAGGDVAIGQIISASDAAGNDVSIRSVNGDVLIDLVQVGKAYGRIFIESENGSIREADEYDAAADLVGYYGYLKAQTIIGSLTDPNLNLEFDLSILEIEAYDLIISVDGDVELNIDLLGIVDVTASGTITVTHLTAAGNYVKLTAIGEEADILIAYLDAGADEGQFIAQAGRDIREVDAFDEAVDLIAHSSSLSAGRYIGSAPGSGADLDLETDIDLLTAYSYGRFSINESHDISLASVSTLDGTIIVNAGGDISIGYVSAGFESGTVELTACGSIRETADHDPDIDLIASQVSLSAGADIGDPQDGDLTLETRAQMLSAHAGTDGSIFINECDSLVLSSILAPGGAIGIVTGGDILIDGPLSAGTETTLHAGGVMTMGGEIPVTSLFLEIVAGYGIDVETEVEILSASITEQGLLQIHEADSIILQDVINTDGAIRISAYGTITALHVEALTDAPGNNVSLLSFTGDVLIDYVAVGTAHGQLAVSAPAGDIREVDAFDADVDVAGSLGILFAGGEIGSKANPELNLETALGRLVQSVGRDLKLHIRGDIDLVFIASGKIDVQATGTINAIYLVSLTNDIHLTSFCGDINVEYLEAAGSRGDVSLRARGDVRIHGTVQAGDDVDIWANHTVSLRGGLAAGDDIEIRAGAGVLVQGALVSQAGEVDIDACWGMLEMTGSIAAAGDVELAGRLGVAVTGELLSGDDIEVQSCRGDVNLAGTLDAADEVEIHSGSNVSIEADVSSGEDITIWAKDTVSVCGELAAGGDVNIWAGKSISIAADLNAEDDVTLWAGCTVWVYGDISAKDDLYIFGGCSVEISGAVEAGDRLYIRFPRGCCKYCHRAPR